MTQEDKELLLKDLCGRLPYGVVISLGPYDKNPIKINSISIISIGTFFNGYFTEGIHFTFNGKGDIWPKPYLRPMSSMTEEEKEEITFIRNIDFQSVRKWFNDESLKETGNIYPVTCGENDYCNKKHLDYRGLIEKGLALEAPEGMYK